jgi:hypothetical protein
MEGVGKFKEDLKLGKAYEDEVIEIFKLLFNTDFRKITKEEDPAFYLHLDVIEISKKKKEFPDLISAECKYSSSKHDDSPNVVVEYQTYDQAVSGLVTSLATYWVFKTGRFHMIVRRDELLRTVLFDLSHTDSHRKIKFKTFDHKKILLIPIELLMDTTLCPSTQRQLTREAMMKEDSNVVY